MATELQHCLPDDFRSGRFIGRALSDEGPCVILIDKGKIFDITSQCPTVSGAFEKGVPDSGVSLGDVENGLPDGLSLLAPIDLQCVKAAGVTFALSAIERVIEERAGGDPEKASAVRDLLEERIGGGIRSVIPGSDEAQKLKATLIAENMWSQYLEVAIGPDAEIFSKSPVLSSVGHGAKIGIRSDSDWNNPEPEIVLICNKSGEILGATLGNDVNLRDFEGRSALLLSKAKDNRGSCSIGPFIRLFDDGFTLDDVRRAKVGLNIQGPEGYNLSGTNDMGQISRDPSELVRQCLSEHDYPDGFVMFCGTLFAPTQDRDQPGKGFTHKIGDIVTISSPRLGVLENEVVTSKEAKPWAMGLTEFMRNLNARKLIDRI